MIWDRSTLGLALVIDFFFNCFFSEPLVHHVAMEGSINNVLEIIFLNLRCLVP